MSSKGCDRMFRAILIGCGRIAKNHVEAMAACTRAEWVGFCDLVKARAEEKRDAYETLTGKHCPVSTDYKALMEETSPDVVVIATESGNHYEIAKNALLRGIHVLVEKPITMKTEEADELIRIADEKGLTLGACHQNRFNPVVRALRRAVESGALGKIYHVTARILWTRDDAYYKLAPWRGTEAQDGGTLMNQCIHAIDLLRWTAGAKPVRVQAERARFSRPIEMEDFGAALVRFENGTVGIIEGTANVYPSNLEETLSVFAEKGTIVLGGMAVNKILTWRVEDFPEPEAGEEVKNVYGRGHLPLYEDYFAAIEEKREPLVSGREGRDSLALVRAIYEAAPIE